MSKDFRKAYYSTLGVQTVEAKASLDAAFAVDPIDLPRLISICQAVRIPRMYRPLVWKSVLGVVPPAKETWGFGEETRFDQFEDLRRAAAVLFLKDQTPCDDDFTADIMKYERIRHLFSIADCILEICDGRDVDAYWIFRYFVVRMQVPLTATISKQHYSQCTALGELLKTHNPSLSNHLERIGVDLNVIAENWFSSFFALVLPAHCLEGIWDAVISGAWDILLYLGLSLLLASKRKIEGLRNPSEFTKFLLQIEDFVNVDAVSATAIDLWEKNRKE
ncbi:hypothetical protein BDR26DRAFT_53046 [Obelidium mucronatum]|nr:hypothetical protein BDR26DRAFT_53046 [Obelidium mucronatum]